MASLKSGPPIAILDNAIWLRPVPSPIIKIIFFGFTFFLKELISIRLGPALPIGIYSILVLLWTNKKNKTIAELDDKNSGFGFYGYLIFIIVFVVMFFGVLNLSKDYIVSLYPLSAVYIDYLYEVVDIIKTIILQLLNQF